MDEFALFLMKFSSDILPHVIAVVTALVVSLLIFVLRRRIVALLCTLVKKLTSRLSIADAIVEACRKPLVAFLTVLALYLGVSILTSHFLPYSTALPPFLLMILKITLIICITWGAMDAADPIVTVIQGSHDNLDHTIVSFLSKIVKVILLIISMVIIIDEVGYNITGLITGLGLGGLTFALAAQDTASNFFGGVVIITDKPFQVGDWIQTSSLEGVVTDISLRSTRIRTFKDAEIIVPNSSLANTAIINCSRMNKRKVEMTLGLTYGTSREKLQEAASAVREIIKEHSRVEPEGIVVAFNEFAAYSLNITVAYFVKDTSFQDYMKVKEEINFQIMDCLQAMGAEFAFPTQTLIVEQPAAPQGKLE